MRLKFLSHAAFALLKDAELQRKAYRVALSSVFLVFLTLPFTSHAQINTGGIVGRVTDPSGAVVVNAQVTIQNLQTGTTTETTASDTGDFGFRGLLPGMYKLTVTASGFNTAEVNNIPIRVAEIGNQDVQLSLGTTTTAISVTSSAVALETASAQLGTTVEETAVRDLPLNGRNFTQLLVLTAGAASSGTSGIWGNPQAGDYRQPSINGQDTNSTGFVLDGTNNRSNFSGGISVAPVVDDIEEFKVVSHSDSVEYGGYLGGYVNVVTKGGTNDFHGAAWEFMRNDKLDARNPFRPSVNHLRQNQFGANFGGPIVRNKLFFFGSYQGFRQRIGSTAFYRVPTAAQLAGDFTYKVDGVTPELPIYNMYSTVADANASSGYTRDPFMCDAGGSPITPDANGIQTGGTACNKIPSELINPYSAYYATLFPAPVDLGSGVDPQLNGLDTNPQKQRQDFWTVRGDYNINSSQQVNFRYSDIGSPNTVTAGAIDTSFLRDSFGYNMASNYTYTITPTTVFHAMFGHTWVNLHLSSVWDNLDYDSFVFPTWPWACNLSSGFGSHNCWAPMQGIGGGYTQVNNFDTYVGQTNIWEGSPTLDHIRGNHFIKVGGTFARHRIWAVTQRMFVNYSATQTADLNNTGATGANIASFLLGLPIGGEMADTYPGTQQPAWTWGVFAQDQWKVNSKFSFNFGMRWDLFNPGQYGTKGTTNFYSGRMDVRNGIFWIPADPGGCSTVGQAPCIPGDVLPEHVQIAPGGKISQVVKDNFAPRVGIAYRLKPNTVLRAGIGRYYDQWGNSDVLIVQSEGLWPDSKAVAVANKNGIFFDGTTSENPLGITIGAGQLPDPNGPFNLVRTWLDPDFKNPAVDQWNVGIQQQFGPETMLEVNYVGSRGARTVWQNWLGMATTPGTSLTDVNQRKTYPWVPPAPVYTDRGRNWYNGLQVTMKRRQTNGLSYQLVYTWSKNLDLNGGQNGYNLAGEKARSGLDLSHVLALGWVYDLPFGKGRFDSGSRAANAVIGGWQFNGLLQATSGVPFGVFYCGDTANVGRTDCYMRPNIVGNPEVSNPTIQQWYDVSAFEVAANGTFGNAPRNFMEGDGLFNMDLSVFRNFTITEKTTLQFRFEAFNITNTPTFGNPQTNIQSGSAGRISGTRSVERQLQFALKLYF